MPIILFGQEANLGGKAGLPIETGTQQPVGLPIASDEAQGEVKIGIESESNTKVLKTQFAKDWNFGLGLSLAQPSFTVGHPSNMRGYYAELVNSTLMASVNMGKMVAKGDRNLLNCNLVLSYLRLKEDDLYADRGAAFDVKMAELLAISDFYVLNMLKAKSGGKMAKMLPFLRFGVGFGIGDYTIINGNVEPKPINFALPIGLGLRWELSKKTALVFDYMSRVTFSDSLDGLTSPFGKNDWYGSGGIGLSFRLGKEEENGEVVGK